MTFNEQLSDITDTEEDNNTAGHRRTDSMNMASLNKQILNDLYHGPKRRHPNIVMINGKMMTEDEAVKYSNDEKMIEERRSSVGSDVSKLFDYLNEEEVSEATEDGGNLVDLNMQEVEVEINHKPKSPATLKVDIEQGFGEKVEHDEKFEE